MPYKDAVGLWTIGYGNRISEAEATQYSKGVIQAQAEFLMETYLRKQEERLAALPFDTSLMQHQFDAIMSFIYNLGWEQFAESTLYKLLKINSPNAIDKWLEYDHAGGKKLLGLTKRRVAEVRMFVYGKY